MYFVTENNSKFITHVKIRILNTDMRTTFTIASFASCASYEMIDSLTASLYSPQNYSLSDGLNLCPVLLSNCFTCQEFIISLSASLYSIKSKIVMLCLSRNSTSQLCKASHYKHDNRSTVTIHVKRVEKK